MKSRIGLRCVLLLVGLLATLVSSRYAYGGGVGVSTPPEETEVNEDYLDEFRRYKPLGYGRFAYRDLEFHWDARYDSVRIDSMKITLDAFGRVLADSARNPFGSSLSDIQLTYDYFRHPDSTAYDSDPYAPPSMALGPTFGWTYNATTKAFIPGGYISEADAPDVERAHVDHYLYVPGHGGNYGGSQPSGFLSMVEDSNATNYRVGAVYDTADIYPKNSTMFAGPPNNSSRFDMDGTGWTAADQEQNWGMIHEFQHTLNGDRHLRIDEIFSSGAEALTGNEDYNFTSETPYTWNLFEHNNYQNWRLFSAYLIYNFRGLDLNATVAGFSDDLFHRWAQSGRRWDDLRDELTNSKCAECAKKDYFNPGGAPLDSITRINMLLHNWRVANFVNNIALADSQYGFPAEFNFIPSRDVGAWQQVYADSACPGGCGMEFKPTEITAHEGWITSDTTIAKRRWREDKVESRPLEIQAMAAGYWIVRCDSDLVGESLDLFVRVSPESLYRAWWEVHTSCVAEDGRLAVSVVGYDVPSDSLTADLWANPHWASKAWDQEWVDVDSAAAGIEFIVPNFGTDYTAAVVILSLGDGPSQGVAAQTYYNFWEPDGSGRVPYRLNVGFRTPPYLTPNPQLLKGGVQIQEHPTWSPDGDQIAYVEQDATGHRQIWIQTIGGSRSLMESTSSPESQDFPDWSPRGGWIAYSQRRPLAAYEDLYVHNVDTDSTRTLTTTLSSAELCPAFSPNGQQIAYLVRLGDPDLPPAVVPLLM